MKQSVRKKIIGGLSVTSALFIFQACYGTPQDFGHDVYVEGQVKSSSTGAPIKGVQVSVSDKMQYEVTNDEGRFAFYTEKTDSLKLSFLHTDKDAHTHFVAKDTVLNGLNEQIRLNIALDEQK